MSSTTEIKLTKVVMDNVYESIHEYVDKRTLIVDDYDAMVEVILSMIKDGYCFAMDRDILRDAMESLTYMYTPSDDMNKDRLVQQFADEVDDSESEEEDGNEDGGEFGNMDLMKMMQMMGGGMPSMGGPPGAIGTCGSDDTQCPSGIDGCDPSSCTSTECAAAAPTETAAAPTETAAAPTETAAAPTEGATGLAE
jgi:hypothetical protein